MLIGNDLGTAGHIEGRLAVVAEPDAVAGPAAERGLHDGERCHRGVGHQIGAGWIGIP